MSVVDSPVLSVSNLSIAFGTGPKRVEAVRGASFDVRPGEIVGIVGESGSGKSTVAFACTGFIAPGGAAYQGTVSFRGRDLLTMSDGDLRHVRGKDIAMVYQNPLAALNPSMRVGDQLNETIRNLFAVSEKEATARSIELLESVHLPDPAGMMLRYPHELSGGQQQRVIIAMALPGDPAVLLMDEPTTGLDVTTEATILDLILELRNRSNTGIVFVTHNLGVVARVCDRVVVMYAGEVIETAPVDELFAHPDHPYTRGLLGAVPRIRHRSSELTAIPGQLPRAGAYPTGCAFSPRCPLVADRCRTEHPELLSVGEAHASRCHYWESVQALEIPSSPLPPASRSSATSETVLSADGIEKHFDEGPKFLSRSSTRKVIKAVNGVSFTLGAGETLAIVGESGCGKSTLTNTLVGLQKPSAGTLSLFGSVLAPLARARKPKERREVQIVFQNPDTSLNPAHTVFETIARPIKLFGNNKGRQDVWNQVNSILHSVNLDESYGDRYPSQLSGGEKQRVGIARAIAAGPSVIICDESVSALDVSVQATVLNLLRTLQRERDFSYIFVSHDLAVVRYIADHVAVMYLGQVVETGPAPKVFSAPSHPYTESLLSAVSEPDPLAPDTRIRLPGTVPSAAALPSGCPFHTRCPRKLGPICEDSMPPWQAGEDGHRIRCHIPLDTLRALQKPAL